MSGPRQSEARSFNENCPRPPVPGGETEKFTNACRPQSPALTPRRSSLVRSSVPNSYDASSAPLGFEPEGSCETTTMESDSPPACLRWAKNLHNLLHDPEGLELFRKYLDQEGRPHVNPLNFWFACEGLKKQRDRRQIHELIKLIHGRFFVKSQLAIPEEIRKEANRRVKEGLVDKQVFDEAQQEVELLINETTYPNFLRSDTYLRYVQSCQNTEPGGCPSPGSSREISLSCGPTILPTLFEDSEFTSSMHSSHPLSVTSIELVGREKRLTPALLMETQETRAFDFKRRPEAYAGIYIQPGVNPYHVTRLHAQYSSYNPVSRQDSELQSVSSDARTESDTMSLNEYSIDGMSIGRPLTNKKQNVRQKRAIKENAALNRDYLLDQTVIPRTQRCIPHVNQPKDPQVFAQELIGKLEVLKRQQDNGEKLLRNLFLESTSAVSGADSRGQISTHLVDSRGISVTDQLRQKLMIEDDNDQAILDQHVSRVWADQTPSRSPGLASPRPRSPERKRPIHSYSRSNKSRKDKDVFSTFSVDSGNIHDFPEGNDLIGAGSMSSLGSHLPKSKSVPSDYADSLHKHDFYLQSREQRMRRSEMAKKSTIKKSLTELTDSGVSVFSGASSLNRDRRFLPWVNRADKTSEVKYVRQQLYSSRSESLERGNQDILVVPAQPFIADPGMPPPPQPHTDTQLEEAKRRLLPLMEDNRGRSGNRQRYPSNKQMYEPSSQNASYSQSNQSTLRKTKLDDKDFTTVVFSFCEEQVPYRTKILGHNVTLKQFKEVLPKKGSYRFFFKTECEDLDVKVIQEEITDDTEILPLWEGKVMAEVKALE